MSEEAPSGYITMTAGEIAEGARRCLAVVQAKQQRWDDSLQGWLETWANRQSWWTNFWYSVPRDSAKLTEWYHSFEWSFQRPQFDNIPDRVGTPGHIVDWARRMRHLEPDTKVFIDVEDAATLKSWLKDDNWEGAVWGPKKS